ncbi:TetR/AcrR family transcriptional regulator [Parvibaculum sp.]|uniref:TetR/AcrR family transcriptional regulator n=1 Tax=Parvibaculum sp. TaxID=2024848 RepID=UPI001B270505|nr:TetR/AcrR family transcriptional regulator [Parvibaculum sp.]MBO6667055.1 TetR/AcrR family transcriptional regulator [Parvibaculum sp.]MBO6690499.1 TetR/AcrR family transcriptional regulator [Parvibaculum sp.]MBO6716125.1 TetR/AcrR family transcriptional regulator [Parvibaculum sp.]
MKPPKSAQTILEVKSRKGHRAREAIFEAAIRVAGAEGLAALNVSRIAEVAGIGRASFYNYFDSVDDVVAELMKRLQEELEEALTEVHGEFDRGAARFAACVGEVMKRLSEDADFANLCREVMRGSEEVREQFRKASRPEIEAAIAAGTCTLSREEIDPYLDLVGLAVFSGGAEAKASSRRRQVDILLRAAGMA